MEHEAPEGDPLGGDDPFEGFIFDDDFVRSASITEPSAEQREREARQANLQRLLADHEAIRENERHATRRFAPDDDDPFADQERVPRRRRGQLVVALIVIVAIVAVYVLSQFLTARRRPDDLAPAGASTISTTTTAAPAATTTTVAAGPGSVDSGAVDSGAVVTGDGQVATAAPAASSAARPANWPPRSTEEQASPLGRPGPVPDGGGAHTFVELQADGATPVAYDPCRPIHYVMRESGAPAQGAELLRDALAATSLATGLVFVDDGATDEGPVDSRDPYQPDAYGDRWAPVLISWSNPEESPRLAATDPTATEAGTDVLGYAGSSSAGFSTDGATPAQQIFVSGAVVLDAPDLTTLLDGFDGYARARAVVMHELGHLVGLDHVDDGTQLMSPFQQPEITGYAAGDLQGLAALGSGACVAEI